MELYDFYRKYNVVAFFCNDKTGDVILYPPEDYARQAEYNDPYLQYREETHKDFWWFYDEAYVVEKRILDRIQRLTGIRVGWNMDIKKFNKVYDLYKYEKQRYLASTGRGMLHSVWAKSIKDRDAQCVKCGSISNLHAHHIVPWNEDIEKRYDFNNGITLCKVCHFDIHNRRENEESTS